jgi:hypothetical protein
LITIDVLGYFWRKQYRERECYVPEK